MGKVATQSKRDQPVNTQKKILMIPRIGSGARRAEPSSAKGVWPIVFRI